MPEYAVLSATPLCPRCGCEILDAENTLRFQWGALPKGYEMGEKIVWSKGLLSRRRWTVGDPKFEDVVIIESDVNIRVWSCGKCGTMLDRPCIEVRKGKIVQVLMFEAGAFEAGTGYQQQTANCFEIGSSGNLVPRPEFDVE